MTQPTHAQPAADVSPEVRDAVLSEIDAWIMSGRPQSGKVDVCLAGDVRDEYDEIVDATNNLDARRLALVAQRKELDEAAVTMGDRAGVAAIDEQLEGIIAEQVELQARLDEVGERMREATRTVHMRAIDPNAYRRLQLEHPARDDDAHDQLFMVNVDTFFPALVTACTTRITKLDGTEQPAPTLQQWERLQTILSSHQWDAVWGLAHSLNRRELTVPKSSRPSGPTRSSGQK